MVLMKTKIFNCKICGRETPEKYLEKHHLVPKTGKETILVCINCGDILHKLFDNSYLTYQLNSIEKILQHEEVKKWIAWIRKKKDFSVCMKEKKKR